jgi:hypothetical protein
MIIKYWKEFLILLLITALSICSYVISNQKTKIQIIEKPLPPKTVIVEKNTIKYLDKIIYVPAEGGVTIDTSGDTPTVKVDNWGVCFRPGVGLGVATSMALKPYSLVSIDSKLLYFDRWSSGLGIGYSDTATGEVWISRHLDDLSFGLINNLELKVFYGYTIEQKQLMGLGFRTNW